MECSCANWVITGKSHKFTTQVLFHSSVWFNLLSFSYLSWYLVTTIKYILNISLDTQQVTCL